MKTAHMHTINRFIIKVISSLITSTTRSTNVFISFLFWIVTNILAYLFSEMGKTLLNIFRAIQMMLASVSLLDFSENTRFWTESINASDLTSRGNLIAFQKFCFVQCVGVIYQFLPVRINKCWKLQLNSFKCLYFISFPVHIYRMCNY